MSVRYRVEGDILRIIFEAASISEEIYVAVNKAYQDPECPEGADILLDLRGSTSIGSRSVEGIRTLSKVMVSHPSRPGRRIAILLQHAEAERLHSMAEQFTEETGIEIRIFEEESAACHWLGRC